MSVEEVDLGVDYESIAKKVINNRANWIDRGDFYTFGAASYLDGGCEDYFNNLNKYNKIIKNEFGDVLNKLIDYFGAETHESIALPGFHIFDRKGNTRKASIHKDVSFKKLPIFNQDYKNAKSFTVLINKPDCGAGLNVWDEEFNKTYHEYELGKMYVHSGGLRHQIANNGDIKKGEQRITMQGHVITFKDKTYIYF